METALNTILYWKLTFLYNTLYSFFLNQVTNIYPDSACSEMDRLLDREVHWWKKIGQISLISAWNSQIIFLNDYWNVGHFMKGSLNFKVQTTLKGINFIVRRIYWNETDEIRFPGTANRRTYHLARRGKQFCIWLIREKTSSSNTLHSLTYYWKTKAVISCYQCNTS